MLEFKKLFISFFIFSIIGWIIEELVTYRTNEKFVNRGFLIGPYCPIYGFGYIFITMLLTKFKSYPIGLFIFAIVICSILEYITSYIMEKLFNARWWDYSDRKFNINGRVCLTNTLAFGILGLLIIYVINPIYFKFISIFSDSIINIIFYIILIVFITDLISTIKLMSIIKDKLIYFTKDNTNEIKKIISKRLKLNIGISNVNKIKDKVINHFKNDILIKRILNAFPDFKPIIKNKNNKQD